MSKLILSVFEHGQNGPAASAANAAYAASDYIEGTWHYDASNAANAKLMNELGVKAPAVVLGRYCPDGAIQIKHIAQLPGIPSVTKIVKAVDKYRNDPQAMNCNVYAQTNLPNASTPGTGTDGSESGGVGLNPWGVFSLPFDFPWWIWAAIAGGAAIGANGSRTKVGMYGLGGLAVLAGGNAYNSYKKQNG